MHSLISMSERLFAKEQAKFQYNVLFDIILAFRRKFTEWNEYEKRRYVIILYWEFLAQWFLL